MLPISTKDLVRHSSGGATFDLAVPSRLQRAAFRRDLAATGARYPSDAELRQAMRDGIEALVAEDQRAELLEAVDQLEAGDSSDQVRERIEALERVLVKRFAPYGDLLAARGHWLEVAPIVACQHFLRGWDGLALPFASRAGLVPPDLLDQALSDEQIVSVGLKILSLMSPGKDQEKNSASPSPSPSAQPILPAEPNPPTTAPDGNFSETSTPAIPDC